MVLWQTFWTLCFIFVVYLSVLTTYKIVYVFRESEESITRNVQRVKNPSPTVSRWRHMPWCHLWRHVCWSSTEQVPPRNRTIEVYGFTDDSIQNYIEQFSRDNNELKVFIGDYLKNNVNIASMCCLPVHCNFVCVCLSDMHLSTQSEDSAPAVTTMTQLYVLAAINLAKKLHPALKHINMPSDSKLFFDMVGNSLKCHSELTKHNTMSTPVRILCYEGDLDKFGVREEDRGTGFLAECQMEGEMACWTFNHLTLQEMFAAIRLLQGPQQALLELVEDEASIRQRDVLIKFVIGLWCDSQNAWFMEHLGSVRGQLDPQTHPHPGKLTHSV